MSDRHLSSQYDVDLTLLLKKLLEMGQLVESQVTQALRALGTFNMAVVEQVVENERELNAMEVEIDEDVSNIIARRQPAARDVRLLMAASKAVTDLERAGDEARKMARRIEHLQTDCSARKVNGAEIRISGEMAVRMLHNALDAFARQDAEAAAQVIAEDEAVDNQFRAFVRRFVTCMTDNPRAISVGLDYLCIAKAIERIGDHATNIAEFTIYVADGTDVRHRELELTRREALGDEQQS